MKIVFEHLVALGPGSACKRLPSITEELCLRTGHASCWPVQVISFKIPFTNWWAHGQGLQYGTGVISVAGISFTFLTTGQESIKNMMVCCPPA